MRRLFLALLLIALALPAHAQTLKYLSGLSAGGALSDTDTLPICQTSTGCVQGVPLKTITPLQLNTYVGSKGYLINPNVALTGTPTAPTAAQGANGTQIATTAFVKLQQHAPPTVSWVVGGTPANGVLLGRASQALTITGIWCAPTVSGDSGATIDVYTAPSGTGGTSGTKLTTTSCNPNSTANADQNLLSSGTPAIPIGNHVYLVASGFPMTPTSAGYLSMQVSTQ